MKQKLILLTVLLITALSAFPAEYYVSATRPNDGGNGTSWAKAKKTIQAAVNLTKNGDTVWVTNGTYVLSSEVFVTNAITIRSVNGPAVTIVDGNGVTRCFNLSGECLVSGLTITNGFASGEYPYWRGGGIYCSTPFSKVSNCVISGNSIGYGNDFGISDGGGMCGGFAVDCVFSGNTAGGGGGMCSGVASNCSFIGNLARGSVPLFGNLSYGGGGMSGGTAYNCTFTSNSANWSGGAMERGTAYNSTFNYNVSSYAGGGLSVSMAHGCVFRGNSSYCGGGVYYSTSYNCTFIDNNGGLGAGISDGTAYNCVFSGNTVYDEAFPADIYNSTAYNSCSLDLEHGVDGNITNAPLFVDEANGNFRLQAGSPCINAGDNSYVSTATDLDGNPRIVGGVVDMGAYEYDPSRRYLTVTGGIGSGSYTNTQVVAISANSPAAGKAFDRWIGDTQYVNNVTYMNALVTMSTNPVSLTATYVNAYTLTVAGGTGSGSYANGSRVTIAANIRDGRAFERWVGATQYVASVTSSTTTVTMPAGAASLIATYKKDHTDPTLEITSPTAELRILATNGLFIVQGTASDNKIVANVLVKLNGGAWTNASTTDGWKSWSLPVILKPGENRIRAYSVDSAMNRSSKRLVECTYVPGAVMTVQINGAGTITSNYNGQVLKIGKRYKMTAKAVKNTSVFTDWTYGLGGPVASSKREIAFVMQSNLVLTASFRSLVAPAAAAADIAVDIPATPQASIIVDGSIKDWANVPCASFCYASVTQEVAVALDGNNVALLLNGCPFSTSDTVMVYFKLRLSDGDDRHTVDLWTSGSVLYGMVDGQVITGLEAVLLNGVLEVKLPIDQAPSQVTIEEVACGIDSGLGGIRELFTFPAPENFATSVQ